MGVREKSERGQMTVELAVVFPIIIVVAMMAVNALLFIGECASFDRLSSEAVRTYASSPAYGETATANCGLIEQSLDSAFDKPYLDVGVSAYGESYGQVRFDATLEFAPTLFGMGLRSEVFGVALPKLTHTSSYVIDPYKPGVIA